MLNIFERNVVTSVLQEKSENGDFDNPIVFNPNGDYGDKVDKQLYLTNDDGNKYYVNVFLSAIPKELASKGNPSYPQAPFKVKILVQAGEPTELEWDAVEPGNIASVGSIGAISAPDTSDHSFWVRLETPANLRIGENRNIQLQLSFEEFSA